MAGGGSSTASIGRDAAAFPPQESMVRRTDVALRAAYPHLVTRIFELAPHRYVICFSKEQLHASTVSEYFQKSIRPVAVAIELANGVPSNYLSELAVIADDRLARGLEGFSFTHDEIGDILLSRYPDLPLLLRAPNRNNPITFVFESALTPEQERNVRAVLEGIMPGWPIAITTERVPAMPEPSAAVRDMIASHRVLDVRPHRLRPNAPAFVREDEAFWHEHVDAIFEGRLLSLPVPETADAGMACYIDASSFPQIDLRQAVLVYDTIFFAPPLADRPDGQDGFWQQQRVTRDDVLKLIEAGRLRLVLSQPEERTDTLFLRAAHERNPSAVIGRLRAAAIAANDIVQTCNEYTFARPDLTRQVGELASLLAQDSKVPAEVISRLLLWPLHARRACLAPLMRRGLMGVANFSQGSILSDELKSALGNDYELEAVATSVGVHVAHTLNATLIPPTKEMAGWLEPRRIVGDRLNFYRSFNRRIAASWAENERRKERRVRILPPIPLFDFTKRAPIEDLIAATSLSSTRRQGRALVTRLAELPANQREAAMDRLCQEFYDLGVRRGRRSLVVDSASDIVDIASTAMSVSMLPIKGAWATLQRALALARKVPALDSLVDALEQDMNDLRGRNSDLDFLSKVNRVAELRDPKEE